MSSRIASLVLLLAVAAGCPAPTTPPATTVTELTANAGRDRTVPVGQPVTLDGSHSVDPDGKALSFSWSLQSPPLSSAALTDAKSGTPSFVPDVAGDYVVKLTVSNGDTTADDRVTFAAVAIDGASPPETSFTQTPPSTDSSHTTTFAFSSTKPGSFFCSLDGAAASKCTSPLAVGPLDDGAHRFVVQALDSDGLVDPTPAEHRWTISAGGNSGAADTFISGGPTNPSNQLSATIFFGSNRQDATFTCALDGAPAAACTSPFVTGALSEGTHSVTITATAGGAADPSPATYSWVVDSIPPTTTLTTAVPALSSSASASFTFTSEMNAITYCSVDGAAFARCSSPQSLTQLQDGAHTFAVRAVDLAGNIESPAQLKGWVIDTVPPDTNLSATPTNPSRADVSFTFSSADMSASFRCTLDGMSSSCTSPRAFTLTEGAHVFTVAAVDPAGNVDPTPQTFSWNVDLTPPVTSFGSVIPPAQSNNTSPSFTFSANETSIFRCSLDGAAYATCTSPQTVTLTADGSHTFSVYAVDAAGNEDASPAQHQWTLDTVAPDTYSLNFDGQAFNGTSLSLQFSSTETSATYQCKVDAASFAACTSPHVPSGLAEGTHTFTVRACDPVGNCDVSPASVSFVLDNTPPAVPVLVSTTALDAALTVQVTLASDAAYYEIAWNTDGSTNYPNTTTGGGDGLGYVGPLTNCVSTKLVVRSVDLADNKSAWSAPFTAIPKPVKADPPTVSVITTAADVRVPVAFGRTARLYYGSSPTGPFNGGNAWEGSSPLPVNFQSGGTLVRLSGLPPYAPTYFAVATVDGSCEGPLSDAVPFTPVPWKALSPAAWSGYYTDASCASGQCYALGGPLALYNPAGGSAWSAGTTGAQGNVWSVDAVSPTVAYATADPSGGLPAMVLKTTNGGATWRNTGPAPSSVPFGLLAKVSFATDQIGFVANHSGAVFRTLDGGASWQSRAAVTASSVTGLKVFSNGTTVVLVTNDGLYRSVDAGASWTKLFSVAQNAFLNCKGDSICALTHLGASVSTDQGATWTSAGSPPSLTFVYPAAVGLYWAAGYGGVHLSINGGSSWTQVRPGENPAPRFAALGGTQALLFSGSGDILRTTDSGSTWQSETRRTPKVKLLGVAAPTASTFIAVGEGGNVLRSTDAGGSFTVSQPVSTNLTAVTFANATTGFIVGESGVILKTTNAGQSWTPLFSGTLLKISAVGCIDDQQCYAAAGSSLLKTTNGGTSWQQLGTATGNEKISLLALDAQTVFLGGFQTSTCSSDPNVISTSNGGNSFTPVPVSNGGFGQCSNIKSLAAFKGEVFASHERPSAGESRLWRLGTTDWTALSGSSASAIYSLTATSNLLVGVGRTFAGYSLDGQSYRSVMTGGLTPLNAATVVPGGNGFLAVGDDGVVMSSPLGR